MFYFLVSGYPEITHYVAKQCINLQLWDLARRTLFQSSCVIPTLPAGCSDDSWRDTFFGKLEHCALWLLICDVLEKHPLTYLLTALTLEKRCYWQLDRHQTIIVRFPLSTQPVQYIWMQLMTPSNLLKHGFALKKTGLWVSDSLEVCVYVFVPDNGVCLACVTQLVL